MLLSPLLLVLQQAAPAPAANAAALKHAARRAEANYEEAVRWYAPVSRSALPEGRCDEVVGRFCLMFDRDTTDDEPPAPANPAVRVARRRAVTALRRAFAADPADGRLAGSLVHYLVVGGRADEAISAARAHRWARGGGTSLRLGEPVDTALAWADWLLGFALHEGGRDSAAMSAFDEALVASPAAERDAALDISDLLDPDERGRYHDLSEAGRHAYERRLWRLADPLYLEPGNPALATRLARHVQTRLLPDAPWVRGKVTWGPDLATLTLRYGEPVRWERVPGTWRDDPRYIESYAEEQVALVPAAASAPDALDPPDPGETPPLESPRARSYFPPGDLRELRALPHQLTRFPERRGAVLRLDGLLPVDSAQGAADPVRTGLFVLEPDSLTLLDRVDGTAVLRRDTARFTLLAAVPPGEFVYSLEALDRVRSVGGRARYRVEVPEWLNATSASAAVPATDPKRDAGRLRLSDVLVCLPFGAGRLPTHRDDPRLRARASLVVAGSDTVGLYAEIRRPERRLPTRYRVEVSLQRLDRRPALARAARWLGRRLGLLDAPAGVRLAWDEASAPAPTTPLAVNLDLGDLDPGLYGIRLAVIDLATRAEALSVRAIRVAER